MAANDPEVDQAYVSILADTSQLNDEITAATDEEQARLDEKPLHVAIQPQLTGFEQLGVLLEVEQARIDALNLHANYQAQLTGVDELVAKALVANQALNDAFKAPELGAFAQAIDDAFRPIEDLNFDNLFAGLDKDINPLRAIPVLVDEAWAKAENFRAKFDEVDGAVQRVADRIGTGIANGVDAVVKKLEGLPALFAGKAWDITNVLSGLDAVISNVESAKELIIETFAELPQVSAIAIGLVGLSGAAIDAAGSLLSLAGGLAQALPVLLALPGVAIGVTVLTLAFGNLKKTMPDVYADFLRFKEAIQADFWSAPVAGVGSLKDSLVQFLGFVQTSFGSLATTLGTFMGTLFTLLQNVSLGSWFDNLNASVVTFQGKLPAIAALLNTLGSVGSAMLVPLASLVGDLAFQFNVWLTDMVNSAGGVEAFANRSVAALRTIIDAITPIGGILSALFEAATAAGLTTFTTLGDRFSNWATILHSDAAQSSLTALFSSASTMVGNFVNGASSGLGSLLNMLSTFLQGVLPTVGTALGTLVGQLATALSSPQVLIGLTSFINGVATGITALTPAFTQLAGLIGAVGPDLGTLATTIGTAFGALSPTLVGIFTALNPIISLLGSGLLQVITAVSPAIQQLHDVLAQALANPALQSAIQAIINAILALVPALSPIVSLVSTILAAVLPLVSLIASALTPLMAPITLFITQLSAILGPIIQLLVQLLTTILTPLMPLITALVSLVLPLLLPALQLIEVVLAILVPIINAMMVLLTPLIDLLTFLANVISSTLNVAVDGTNKVLKKVVDFVQGDFTKGMQAFNDFWVRLWNDVFGFFQGIWNDLVKWVRDFLGIHSPSTVFLEIAHNIIDGLLNGLKAAWNAVIGWIGDALTWVKNTFTAGWNDAKQVVVNIWNGIKDFINLNIEAVKLLIHDGLAFIQNVFSTVLGAVSGIVSGGIDAVTGFFSTGLATAQNVVSGAWQAIQNFFTGGISNAVTTVAGLPGKVLAGLGDLTSTLYNAGVNLIQGFINGIENMFSTVQNSLGDLTSKLASWKGPATTDAVLLYEAGQLVIEGFVNGLESRYDAVRKSLGGLTNDISNTQFALPNASGGLAGVAGMVAAAAATATAKTFIYNNYGSTGLSSEEELFAAASRARMAW